MTEYINQDNQTLFGLGFMEIIPSPRLDFLRVFLANRLASNDNLTKATKKQKHTNENWQYIQYNNTIWNKL